MFYILVSDGDIDYTHIYGSFDSYDEAHDFLNNNIPEDFDEYGEIQFRVIEMDDKSKFSENFE